MKTTMNDLNTRVDGYKLLTAYTVKTSIAAIEADFKRFKNRVIVCYRACRSDEARMQEMARYMDCFVTRDESRDKIGGQTVFNFQKNSERDTKHLGYYGL